MTNLKYSTKKVVAAWLINAMSAQASSRFLQDAFIQANQTMNDTISDRNNEIEYVASQLLTPQSNSSFNSSFDQSYNTFIYNQLESYNGRLPQDFETFNANTSNSSFDLAEAYNKTNFQNWAEIYQNMSQQYNISDQLYQSLTVDNSSQLLDYDISLYESWANASVVDNSTFYQPVGSDNFSLNTNYTNSSLLDQGLLYQNFESLNQTLNQSSGNFSDLNITQQGWTLNDSNQNISENSSQNISSLQAFYDSMDNSSQVSYQGVLNSSGGSNNIINLNYSLQDNSTQEAFYSPILNESQELVNQTYNSSILSGLNSSELNTNQSYNQNYSYPMPQSGSASNNSLSLQDYTMDNSSIDPSLDSNNSQNWSDYANYNNSLAWNLNGENNKDFMNTSMNISQFSNYSQWNNISSNSNTSDSSYYFNDSALQQQSFDQELNQSGNIQNSSFYQNSWNQSDQNMNYSNSNQSNYSITLNSSWQDSTQNQSSNSNTANQSLNNSVCGDSINSCFLTVLSNWNMSLYSYCYSQNGYTCYQDYGPVCDLESGTLCSFNQSNGVTLMSGTYCATLDNSNCFYDQGYLCKNNSNGACMLAKTTNQCFTQDGQTCFNYMQGFCFTFNGLDCTTQAFSIQQGSYCWSNDGTQCSGSGLPYLGQLDGSGLSQNGSFCVTQDNQTCLYDNGYFCNNIYNFTSCNINYTQAITCLTYDSFNCALRQSVLPYKNLESKQRQDIRNYFLYAIQGLPQDSSSIGTCDPQCSQWKDKCCVLVNQISSNGIRLFDKLCMNKFVAQSSMQFLFENNYYSINCQKSNLLNGSIKQISQIISIILASSILATIQFI